MSSKVLISIVLVLTAALVATVVFMAGDLVHWLRHRGGSELCP